jgi:uncharacterized membrane protein YuzA (DUF378 family)
LAARQEARKGTTALIAVGFIDWLHLGLTKYFLIASLMTRAWNDPTMLSQGDVEIATLPIQAQGFVT